MPAIAVAASLALAVLAMSGCRSTPECSGEIVELYDGKDHSLDMKTCKPLDGDYARVCCPSDSTQKPPRYRHPSPPAHRSSVQVRHADGGDFLGRRS